MALFELVTSFTPRGDQPQAIEALVKNVRASEKHLVLKGVTGSGKTFTMAHTLAQVDRPVLILAHNKTLAAQQKQSVAFDGKLLASPDHKCMKQTLR